MDTTDENIIGSGSPGADEQDSGIIIGDLPENRVETGRNPDGTFKPGVCGNIFGRPKNSLKDYVRRKLKDMSDEEKEKYLEKIPFEVAWKMSEGNPHQSSDQEHKGEININISKEVSDKHETNSSSGDNS